MKRIGVLCLLALLSACGESGEAVQDVLDRFDVPPDTEPLVAAIKSAAPLAHIVTAATAEMFGEDIDFVQANTTCTEFPCAVVADVVISDDSIIRPYTSANSAQVAAIWPSETQGILVVLLSGGTLGSSNYQVQSVHTFPVTRRDSDLLMTFAEFDFNVAGEADDPAALTTNEIARELERLNTPTPTDYEVALGMEAWVVDVITQGTSDDLNDDSIIISGGGQYIAIDGTGAELYQLGLVRVELDATCSRNPLDGLAVIQAVETQEIILGQAVLGFDRECDGRARVFVANGNYIGTIGQYVDLSF